MSDPQPTDAFTWTQEPWGRALRCTRLAPPHLFSSRDVMLRDDEGEWAAIAASLGVAPDRLRLVKQVHGIHVIVARRGEPIPPSRPEADIIISDDPAIAIGVRVADCAPLLLHDPVTRAVGAAHAGWRGTAAGAAGAVVRAMQQAFGSRPSDLVARLARAWACCGKSALTSWTRFAPGRRPASLAAWFSPGTSDRSFWISNASRDQLERPA